MNARPPISSLRQELPFFDPAFSWQTFEAFFCDVLNAQPELPISRAGVEIVGRVIRARPYGRPGDVQEGIDLTAEMVGGELWDFQCKRVKTWTPEQTRKAIAACQREADQHLLLVSCAASEECYRVVSENPNWLMWDAREINRRFRELGGAKGAPILFTHFGPNWAEAFFGIPGNSPFIAAEAKFKQELRPDARFHHRHALIGRENLVSQLEAFADDEKARVFLLTGRGGLGKSRLLLEWSRTFQQKRPAEVLRFIWGKNADFGNALQTIPDRLMLVFDDAHRLDEIRESLFPELPRRAETKLVLSLRPGPVTQVMQELLAAGFDTSEITIPEPMKPLNGEQVMTLVDAALKPRFLHLRQYLYAASLDCPLVAVIGAELINSGALLESDLRDAADVRTRVFASLLDDARDVRSKFGAQETDDFLRLVALLGPIKLDGAFFQKAASFLDISGADRVSRLHDALDAVGLLLTTGAGTRVTPDLLSDHLAYDACYDATGHSRTFAERLLTSFSPAEFPRLLQHLAEAEWRAISTKANSVSVVEPLWQWFRERFERSPFYDRREQIHQWGNIAHFQPERTLQLAELALSLQTAPEPPVEFLKGDAWNSHENSIVWLPKMLGAVAENHPQLVARCFDILWNLGRDKPIAQFHNNQSHPLSVMSDVIKFKYWKGPRIHDAALDWLDGLLAGDEWLNRGNRPATIFEAFFQPIFATSIEVNWSSGRTFHFGSIAVSLEKSAALRERARGMWRKLLAREDPYIASQLIPTVEHACDIARMGIGGTVSDAFRSAWDAEREKSLVILQDISRNFEEPLIDFQVRKALMRDLRCGNDSPKYREGCRQVLKSLPDGLDFRIARAALSNAYDEFERETETSNWHEIVKARWHAFIKRVAEETHAAFPNAKWFDHFIELDKRWRGFGFQPNFRELLAHVAEANCAEGLLVCDRLLREPNHPLANIYDIAALSATKSDRKGRIDLIRTGLESDSDELRAATVACCSWWRRDGDLPDAVWEALEALAPAATGRVALEITNFVWRNEDNATARDWHLLTALPFAPNEIDLAGNIAARAADLVSKNKAHPDNESVAAFLTRYEVIESATGYHIEGALRKLAERFPVGVFLTLWRRNQARKTGNRAIESLPYDFAGIPFRNILKAPELAALLVDFERRAFSGEPVDSDELRLVRSAIQHDENSSEWLEAAVRRAQSEDQLHFVRRLGSIGEAENPAFAFPKFTKSLMARARKIGPSCYEAIFQKLTHVGGGRGSTDNEPDGEWKALLSSIESAATQYADDGELGPLFSTMAKYERAWMDSERSRRVVEDDE